MREGEGVLLYLFLSVGLFLDFTLLSMHALFKYCCAL